MRNNQNLTDEKHTWKICCRQIFSVVHNVVYLRCRRSSVVAFGTSICDGIGAGVPPLPVICQPFRLSFSPNGTTDYRRGWSAAKSPVTAPHKIKPRRGDRKNLRIFPLVLLKNIWYFVFVVPRRYIPLRNRNKDKLLTYIV